MRNHISTPRILVSPKAFAVAGAIQACSTCVPPHVWPQLGAPEGDKGSIVVEAADEDLAAITGLKVATVRRAVRELARFGLIVRHHAADSNRTLVLDLDHWIWAAISATTAVDQDAS